MRFILLLLFLIVSSEATDRIALLIGNQNYTFSPLRNPIHDVEMIQSTLKDIGFTNKNIQVLKNANTEEINKALDIFKYKARGVDVALIYFSGHGLQVNGENYLMPTQVNVQINIDLVRLITLNKVIDIAGTAKVGVVLVDACRDNPIVENFKNNHTKNIHGTPFNNIKGLATVILPINLRVIIGFATQAGRTAEDGIGNSSPYAKALQKNLRFNWDISRVLGAVTDDVFNGTNNRQMPIYRSTLGRKPFCLTGRCSNQNETVIIGGLMYQNQPFTQTYTWYEAKEYCQSLSFSGYNNWRLPNRVELKKLLTRKKTQFDDDKVGEYYIQREFVDYLENQAQFWTLRSSKRDFSKAFVISFRFRTIRRLDKFSKNHVLCIRGQ